jgi:tetratricopeptide (TPR) repeat protein
MSSGSGTDAGLALASLMQIDSACDRFEEAWRSGERPDLAAFLADSAEPARACLFDGLLTLEVEFRLNRGEIPDFRACRERFPEYRERIAAVFAQFNLAGNTILPPQDPERATGKTEIDALGIGLPRAELDPAALDALRSAGYEVLGELGRGGMGVVYLARKLALNRPCALKMILAGPHGGSAAAARFRAEAEAVARLRHPGIVQIYHVGEASGLPFLELEYLPGGNLDRKLNGTPRAPLEAARMVEALALAIAEAHGKGIVHRDLKPANVLLDADGAPKIADFGLAKILDSDSELTRTQMVLGSPSYMAPEQAEGRSSLAGETTDVYALGAILYTLLTGSPPFRAATAIETLAQVKAVEPVPPSRLQPGLPRDIETICLKCLEKSPGRRYLSARDLAQDLRRYIEGESITARLAPAWERAWRLARRKPTIAAALSVGGLAVCLLLGGAFYYNARLRQALERTRAAEQAAVDRGRLLIDAYSRLISDVQEKLGDTAATRSIRQGLLTTAIRGLDEVARGPGGSSADLYLAVAHQKLGEILRQIGRADDARRQLDSSLRLAEQLAAAHPGDLAVAECLRDTNLAIGELILRNEQPREADPVFRRALEQARVVATARPERAGATLALAEAYHRLGRALDSYGEMPEAEACFRSMYELARHRADDDPGDHAARDMLASSYLRLARIRRYLRDYPAAEGGFRQAIALARSLRDKSPRDTAFKTHLAGALLDSAILELQRRRYSEARPLFGEAERLFAELAEADPEDRETQVWLVHARYHFGRLERDEEHFARAAEIFGTALDHLHRLDREGKLEGRPAFKFRHMKVLELDLEYCSLAPRVLDEPSIVRPRPPYVTINLLRHRARQLARLGRDKELAETVEALCAFDEGDWEDQNNLARALAACVPYFNDRSSSGLPAPVRSDLRRRCVDKAVAALSRSIDSGRLDSSRLDIDGDLASLRGSPDFGPMIERARSRKVSLEVRYPVR